MNRIALPGRILIIAIALLPSLIFAAGDLDGFDGCRQRFRNDPNKTVIVGDSIGVGIARALGVACPSDRCTAIVGTTIEGARSQLPSVRSSHMIVSLGTNNWGEQSQTALDQKIRTFTTAAGSKKVVAWVGPSQTSKNSKVESGLSRINPWIQGAITNAGISFVNIRDARNAGLNQHHDTVAGEGYHFDSTGYQILAATALNYAGICGKPQLSPGSSNAPTRPASDTATPHPSAGALAPPPSASVLGGQPSGGQGYQSSIIGSALAQPSKAAPPVLGGGAGSMANADVFSPKSAAEQAPGHAPTSNPEDANARPGRTTRSVAVVFFSGLCNSPEACRANEQARASIAPKLPSGATLFTPQLTAGAFPNQAAANAFASSLVDSDIIFIPYSAGHKAFLQVVNALTPEQLKKVRTIVSLEAEYSGFDVGVRRVRLVNPQVEVYRFSSGQFQTNHSRLPGAAGVADAIRTYSQRALGDSAEVPRTAPSASPQTGTRPSELPGSENPAVRTPSQYLPFLFPRNSQSVPASVLAPSQIPTMSQSQSLLKLASDLFPITPNPSTGNAFQPGNNAALNAISGIAAQPISPSISAMSELNAEHLSPPNYAAGISASERLPAGVADTFQPPSPYLFADLSNGENRPASFSFLRGILNRLRTFLGTLAF